MERWRLSKTRMWSSAFEEQICGKCKFYPVDYWRKLREILDEALNGPKFSFHLCEQCTTMKAKQPQRFGKLLQSFGEFGELRRQRKAPKLEVFYIPLEKGYRSINNCKVEQLNDFIRKVGQHMESGEVSQKNAEIILDHCYTELNKRVNA